MSETRAFLTCAKPTEWRPPFDFVYFRPIAMERKQGSILIPDFKYAPNELQNGAKRTHNRVEANPPGLLCECLAVGPGRELPQGVIRRAPVKPGQFFTIDARAIAIPSNMTQIDDDDGETTYVVGGEFIIGVRDTIPSWAILKPKKDAMVQPIDLSASDN